MAKTYKVAYDAGHSASTYRNTGGKGIKYDENQLFEEHTFNAFVAKFAKELAEHIGIEVILTQPLFSETEISLAERVNKARLQKVDLLMSFHADYSGNSNATGHWSFYWHTHAESKRLAQIWDKHADKIMGNHCRNIQESKPDTWTNFHMTREPVKYGIPAILIEHDFFSNRESLDLLLSEGFQKKCAETAVRATCEFLGIPFKPLSTSPEENKMENDKTLKNIQQQLSQLQQKVDSLERHNQMPEIPAFAQKIVDQLVKEQVLLEPQRRSYDLYSILAILARKGVI